MPVTPIKFATQSNAHSAPRASAQRCINAYAEGLKDSKTSVITRGSPGIRTWATCGVGPIRGCTTMGGIPYFASGNSLYSLDRFGAATALGGGLLGSGPLRMADNGTEVIIVGETYGWTYDATNGLRSIADANFYACKTVAFFNSLFACDRLDTNEFFHSELLDGRTWPSLNSGAAETASDKVVAVVEYKGHLFVFGEKTIEPWFFTGTTVFPFQKYDGAAVQRGLASALATVKENEAVFFLGEDKNPYRLDGFVPTPIASPAVVEQFEKMSLVSDCEMFSYSFGTHKFVVMQFPTGNQTWVYDISTQLFHERISLDDGNIPVRWRGSCSCPAFGKTLIGDRFTGKVGYLDSTITTEFDEAVDMILINPVIHAEGRQVFCNYLELDMQAGVGLATGQGSDPQVQLWLDVGDGFGLVEDMLPLGAQGKAIQQLRWNGLGSFYDGVTKIIISDPVLRTVISTRIDVDMEEA